MSGFTYRKQPSETTEVIALDLSGRIPDGETIASYAVSARDGGNTDKTTEIIKDSQIQGKSVLMQLWHGVNGENYNIQILATLTGGAVIEEDITLIVRDTVGGKGLLPSEIRVQFEDAIDDEIEDIKFNRWINHLCDYLYRRILKVDPLRFVQIARWTLSGIDGFGKVTVPMPADLKTLKYDGLGFYLLDESGQPQALIPRADYGETGLGYRIEGSLVRLSGVIEGRVVECRYIAKRNRYDGNDDYDLVLEELGEYDEMILEGLKRLYAIGEDERNDEVFAEGRFLDLVEEMLDDIAPDDKVLAIPASDFVY